MPLGDDRTRNSPFTMGYTAHLVPPGAYNVHLVINGNTSTEQLTLLRDPNTESSEADINAQHDFMSNLHDDIDEAAGMVNELELLRRQLYDLKAVLAVQNNDADIMGAMGTVDSAFLALEGRLVQLNTSGTGQDVVRWPAQLVQKMNYLAVSTEVGDFPPADQYVEVYEKLSGELAECRDQMASIKAGILADFLEMLEENGIDPIVTKQEE